MPEPDVKAPGGGGKGTVKLFGKPVSKKTLYIGLAVVAGVLGYAYYSKRKSAAAGGTGTAAAAGNIDPQTGYPYGSTQDAAALQQTGQPGYNTSGYGAGAIDPNTGIPYANEVAGLGGGGGGGTTTTTPAQSVTIAQWEQECISNLEAGGVDQATIANASAGLPRYLAHLSLTPAQATGVQLAVGLTGPPPGGGSYSIIPAPAPPPPVSKPPPHKPPPEDERAFTEAQKRQAWAPGRARRELGSLYINGHWVSGVPRP
jgi:hypothetical protein